MPRLTIDSTLTMHYTDETFAPPWTKPEPMLMIHGGAESGDIWYAAMPLLGAKFRVIRPDLRGHGQSTIPDPSFNWTWERLAADLLTLLDLLGIGRAHVVGSKFGATLGLYLAANAPDRVGTLTLLQPKFGEAPAFVTRFEEMTLTEWARESNRHRLGTDLSPDVAAWFASVMESCNESVLRAMVRLASELDTKLLLPGIKAPTLIVTTDRNGTATVDEVVEWQKPLAHAELVVLPSDGYHVALIRPVDCARETFEFITRVSRLASSDGATL